MIKEVSSFINSSFNYLSRTLFTNEDVDIKKITNLYKELIHDQTKTFDSQIQHISFQICDSKTDGCLKSLQSAYSLSSIQIQYFIDELKIALQDTTLTEVKIKKISEGILFLENAQDLSILNELKIITSLIPFGMNDTLKKINYAIEELINSTILNLKEGGSVILPYSQIWKSANIMMAHSVVYYISKKNDYFIIEKINTDGQKTHPADKGKRYKVYPLVFSNVSKETLFSFLNGLFIENNSYHKSPDEINLYENKTLGPSLDPDDKLFTSKSYRIQIYASNCTYKSIKTTLKKYFSEFDNLFNYITDIGLTEKINKIESFKIFQNKKNSIDDKVSTLDLNFIPDLMEKLIIPEKLSPLILITKTFFKKSYSVQQPKASIKQILLWSKIINSLRILFHKTGKIDVENLKKIICQLDEPINFFRYYAKEVEPDILYKFIPDELKNDEKSLLSLLSVNKHFLKIIPSELQTYIPFLKEVISVQPGIMEYLSEELTNDKSIISELLLAFPEYLVNYPKLSEDANFILELTKTNPIIFTYASETLLKDKEFILSFTKELIKQIKKWDSESIEVIVKFFYAHIPEELIKDNSFTNELIQLWEKDKKIAAQSFIKVLKKTRNLQANINLTSPNTFL